MGSFVKVKCVECEGVTHVQENNIPEDAQAGEAFEHNCPICKEGRYAVLVEE